MTSGYIQSPWWEPVKKGYPGQVTCDRSNTSASLPSLFQEMKKPSWSTLNLQPSSTSSSLQRSKVSPSRSGLSTGMCHSRTNALVILTPPGDWGLGSRQSRGASTAISIARLLKECTHTYREDNKTKMHCFSILYSIYVHCTFFRKLVVWRSKAFITAKYKKYTNLLWTVFLYCWNPELRCSFNRSFGGQVPPLELFHNIFESSFGLLSNI